MCRVVELNIDGRLIRVADVKQKYMANIIDAAPKCDYIDRVVLFGSACGQRCTEESDIDLAILGNQTKYIADRLALISTWEAEGCYDTHFVVRTDTLKRCLEEINKWYDSLKKNYK